MTYSHKSEKTRHHFEVVEDFLEKDVILAKFHEHFAPHPESSPTFKIWKIVRHAENLESGPVQQCANLVE